MSEERPFNRRNFFRHGMKELLRPLQNMAAPLEEVIKQLGALDLEDAVVARHQAQKNEAPAVAPAPMDLNELSRTIAVPIRPPGAVPEQQFRETCSRCGECVKVCPVQCIKIDASGVKGAGAPYIDVDLAACAMCTGLLCMNTCPSGALVPMSIRDIDMGTAIWNQDTCVRSAGQACTTCIEVCPVGEMAIVLEGNSIKVIEDGCTGCGMCQNQCPTMPKSIVVKPREAASGAAPQPRGRFR